MVALGRGGFTLVEALVSLLISSALVALIGTVFIVQTDFYETQLQRTAAQDNARSVTDLVARELRMATRGGVLVANDTQLVVRTPIAMLTVCGLHGGFTDVFFDGGMARLDTTEVAGLGLYDPLTATWAYEGAAWREIDAKENSLAAQQCALEGADTVGAVDGFMAIKKLKKITPSNPPIGSVLMFYRETEFVLAESTLQPGTIGLYRGAYGGELLEFASGMDPSAQFLYRTGGSGYSSPVGGFWLSAVDAVRLVASTRIRASGGGKDDVTAGWSVDIPLRNVN
jgi:hypothetical protein